MATCSCLVPHTPCVARVRHSGLASLSTVAFTPEPSDGRHRELSPQIPFVEMPMRTFLKSKTCTRAGSRREKSAPTMMEVWELGQTCRWRLKEDEEDEDVGRSRDLEIGLKSVSRAPPSSSQSNRSKSVATPCCRLCVSSGVQSTWPSSFSLTTLPLVPAASASTMLLYTTVR